MVDDYENVNDIIMEFVNKRILIICRETFSYPFYFLTQKWKKENVMGAFFFNPVETKCAESLFNDTTYYAFKKLSDIKIYTSDTIADEMSKLINSNDFDQSFLDDIENNYTHYLNINNQIISSQFLTRHYHWRNYYNSCTYPQQLNWLLLNYKNIIDVLDDFKPDIILDTDISELGRCVLREVAYKRSVPYLSVSYSRIESYLLCTFNLDLHYPLTFRELYNIKFNSNDQDVDEATKYVEQFRHKQSIMAEMYQNSVTSQYKPVDFLSLLKILYGKTKYFLYQKRKSKIADLRKHNTLLYSSSWQYILFFWKYELKKQYLMRKNKYFHPPVQGENYVYMPLHLIPESSTFSMAPYYINEISTIEAVSKSLPAGWWLYVKEHQSMVGERGVDFYKKVNRLPNVRMVQMNYYNDPKPWITKSRGVVTITGTTAFEAAMLGKPSIVFSDVPFSLIEGVHRIRSCEDLPTILKSFSEPLENKKSCAAYIAAVKERGVRVDLHFFHKNGANIIRNNISLPEEGQKVIDNLELLFISGYNYYTKELELEQTNGKQS